MKYQSIKPSTDMRNFQIVAALLLFSFAISILVPHEKKVHAQEKSDKKNSFSQHSFGGAWDEKKAKKIVTGICRGWNSSRYGFSIKGSLPFEENSIPKRFVQVLMHGESCHFCPGIVGGVIFSERNNIWEVEFEEEVFLEVGSFGVAPSGNLEKIGSDRYGILFQWPRTVQGGGYVGYVALVARVGGTFKPVLFLETGYQNYPEYDPPKIEFIRGVNPNFYDIKISSQLYKFVGDEYKAQE